MSDCTGDGSTRLAVLQGTGLLDSPNEPEFDRVTRLAARLLRAPIAAVTLVDDDRQYFKSLVGVPEPFASCRETPRSEAVCRRVVTTGKPLIVGDARHDPILSHDAGALAMGIVAYLGVPLATREGHALGSLCVVDREPRTWSEDDLATLEDLAAMIMTEIALRAECARHSRSIRDLRLLTSAVEAAHDGVVICEAGPIGGLGPKIVYVNQAFSDTTGYAAEEILGKTPRMFQGPKTDRATLDTIRANLAALAPIHAELINYRKDGAEYWVELSIKPVPDEHGRFTHFVSFERDVTERKHSQERNRELAERLTEADRRKDEFLAMLAHELRNPLAPIANAVKVLELRDDEPTLRARMRDLIGQQVRSLSQLVDDLLDVSRITRGKIQLRLEPVNLDQAVARALATTRPLVRRRRHEMSISLPGEHVLISADPLRLEQVLVNLVTNAAKYTDPGGKIEVSAAIDPATSEVVLQVSDNGVGIAPALLPHVFEPFTQADTTLDRAEGGLGVGLTLARSLVVLHGGSVQASSPGTGKGSTFIVRLPLATPLPEPELELEPEPISTSNGGLRVLVVDDNVSAAESLGMILGHWGHTNRVCHDGREAVSVAKGFRPEVVLLDIGLPGMDGYAVARALRARPEHLATILIAVTGYGRDTVREAAEGAEFDHHFVKPVNLNSLERLLHSIAPTRPKSAKPVASCWN